MTGRLNQQLTSSISLLALLVLSLHALPARADSQDEEAAAEAYSLMAVQNRHYFGTHELSVYAGLLPLDAFTKGVTLSGSYTLHFSSLFAWEVAHFFHSLHYDADLKGELEALDVEPTPFEVVDQILTTNFVFKPVYWKGSWLNDSIIHGEFFGVIGGGVGWFTRSTRPAFDVGIGTRIYLSELFSVRLDLRYDMFVENSNFELHGELWLGLGIGITL